MLTFIPRDQTAQIQTLESFLDYRGDTPEDAVAVREFSEKFGIHRSSVYRLLKEGNSYVFKSPEGPVILLRKAAECASTS